MTPDQARLQRHPSGRKRVEGTTTQYMAVDAFQMRQTDIGAVDVAQLHALSMAVGWPHRADDWDFLRSAGQGIAALDDIGRVLGSAMWFSHGSAFATVGMVITSPRLQALGTGQWLMKSVLSACSGRTLRLNATRAARRLYQSLDFVPEKTVFQCQGEAHAEPELASPPQGAIVRRLDASDLAAAVDRDGEAFGVVRDSLIGSLFQESVGYGLFRDDRLEAFALCRRFGRGHVVGPVVAGNDAEAIAVVQPHIAEHNGQFLRLDTHREHGTFPTFLARSGLPVFDTVLTMSFGGHAKPSAADARSTYALVSQALA
jgi:GNAT superfamily N-acetyltransferase